MYAAINNVACIIGGLICVYVLVSAKINTIQPLNMMFVAFSGLAFVVLLLSGMLEPDRITGWGIVARAMGLMAFLCWVASRYKCESGDNKKRRKTDWIVH